MTSLALLLSEIFRKVGMVTESDAQGFFCGTGCILSINFVLHVLDDAI